MMEEQPPQTPPTNSTVDTSRAFSSVKEAVAVFGEKLLSGELYSSPKPPPFTTTTTTPNRFHSPWRYSPLSPFTPTPNDQKTLPTTTTSPWKSSSFKHSPSPSFTSSIQNDEKFLLETLTRLEAELEETKKELKMIKERERETEVALASLNAELHKNMSKVAKAEAEAAAAMGAERRESVRVREEEMRKRRDEMVVVRSLEESPTLAQILSFGDHDLFGERYRERQRKKMKKKPIVPLVGDFIWRIRKGGGGGGGGGSASVHRSLPPMCI